MLPTRSLRALLLLAVAVLPTVAAPVPQFDRYGGTTSIQRAATGHFRVEQVNGRWMFITPEGHGYLALGANHTGKPILVVDWAAPFSLGAAFDSEHGPIKTEADAAKDSAQWIAAALAHPAIVGVFRCQLAGTHGNDRWFEGKAKRTYLRDDGTPFPLMGAKVSEANRAALQAAYAKAAR